MQKKLSDDSLCIHAGTKRSGEFPGVNTPIYTSTAFEYKTAGPMVYPRYYNTPNQQAVIEKIAALEKAEAGVLFSSGMAAISTTMLTLARKGDHILLQYDIYGGTYHFAATQLEPLGIEYSFARSLDPAEYEKAIRPNTKLIYIETPNNPLLKIIDIEAIAAIGKKHGVTTMIDNTFASSVNQNPIALGIDIVMHSGTKYLGGHSDICCGVVVTREALADAIRKKANMFGGSLNAETCYLLERSIKTLSVRVDRHNHNAMTLAEALQNEKRIKRVYYPGLASHDGHAVAKRQMRGFGGMLSFDIDTAVISPDQFLEQLRLIKPALSLGGVESTLCMPSKTSHLRLSAEEKKQAGITDALMRLSVGIENATDILDDIREALRS